MLPTEKVLRADPRQSLAESEHIPVPFRWLDAAFKGLTGRN